MHELLLYGQVPAARHEQVLKILAGIAAMQPRTFLERQLIYRPIRPAEEVKPNKKYPNKPVKLQTLTHHQLVEELSEEDFGKERSILAKHDGEDQAATIRPWIMKVQETPEPETKTLVLRPASETEMTEESLEKVLDPANYQFVNELVAEGHRLIHSNIIVSLFRLLRLTDQPQPAPSTQLPALESLLPLDSTGTLILEARVRIDDRTRPSLISAASDELNTFRDLLRGSVDMRAPERLALDTRVK